jgi:hypothetical protein
LVGRVVAHVEFFFRIVAMIVLEKGAESALGPAGWEWAS